MSILVVGSVAFDSISTPAGSVEKCLGGAATYFSLAASYFTDVRVVAIVGKDFGPEQESVLTKRGVDLRGLEHADGESFHWKGKYENINEAITLDTQLNVFATFEPKVPEFYLDSENLFLANIDPVLQKKVRDSLPSAKLIGADTMNFWITGKRDDLVKVLPGIDALLINDGEAKLLAGDQNLTRAAAKILDLGVKAVVIKHGEYGATAFFSDQSFGQKGRLLPFRAPALPLAEVKDPTGAGDCFAGGFFGYLAAQKERTPESFRRAMFYGGVMGSFAVERFGTERLQNLTRDEIDARFELFRELSHFS